MEGRIGVGIGVMILKEGRVLLGKRNIDPELTSSELKGAGTWTMPGDKLHFNETFETAAFREVLEETGIKLEKAEVICINEDQVENAHFITLGLLAETNQEPKILEPDEITEWRWFNLENLPSPLYFPSAKVLKNYKNKQFYIKEKPKREFLSTVYIIKDRKTLMTFNKTIQKFIPLGGHIDKNELPGEAAIREAKEESGLDIQLVNAREIKNRDLVQPLAIGLDKIKPDHEHINISYVGKVIGGEQLKQSDENTELRWFSPEEIKNLETTENIKEEALKAIEIMENIKNGWSNEKGDCI